MPQDIPLEASKTLAFTPASLAEIDEAPTFTIRTATWREKEARLDFLREVGASQVHEDDLQAEIIRGLEFGWDEDAVKTFKPLLKQYWEAQSDFALARREDPKIVWEFDPALEDRILDVISRIIEAWPPAARMDKKVAKYQRLNPTSYVAVMVEGWKNLDVKRKVEGGVLTPGCALSMFERLIDFETKHASSHSLKPGTAWIELYVRCLTRMSLSGEEEKNSESPSPSPTIPSASKTQTGKKAGKSPASASSKKTRASN